MKRTHIIILMKEKKPQTMQKTEQFIKKQINNIGPVIIQSGQKRQLEQSKQFKIIQIKHNEQIINVKLMIQSGQKKQLEKNKQFRMAHDKHKQAKKSKQLIIIQDTQHKHPEILLIIILFYL